MHKIFGTKENVEYTDREGAYIIPVKENCIGVIKTPKGYFFLGGALENAESHFDCIYRECLEECGYTVSITEKLCSAESYMLHSSIGYFHPIQTYYIGNLISEISKPNEEDHTLVWINKNDLKGKMYSEMQNWALDKYFDLR
jgi:8-oxo-dGTP diphosphatase